MCANFANLHCHSEYSQLDGLSKTEEMVDAALADGQEYMAITDHGTCAGHPDFQLACEKKGIKPIFGMEAYFVHDRLDKSPERKNDYYHLVLWAMDDEGLKNLWAMSTESFKDGFYYKPRLDWDTLQRFNKGIIASTACMRGPLAHPWLHDDEDLAMSNMARLWEIFGDRLYIEIHVNHLEEQLKVNDWLMGICDEYGIEPIAVADSHYAHAEDRDLHRVWLSVQTDSDVADDSSLFGGNQDYHLMTEKEIVQALEYLPPEFVDRAVNNTLTVARRCTAKIEKKNRNPVFTPKGDGLTYEQRMAADAELLLELCLENWAARTEDKGVSQEEYEARFEEEYGLIVGKGFAGYFLMCWAIVHFAKSQGVFMSPARGSGGGSLVAYLISITELDPVEHGILFARFMTKGRVELPDFDIDFPSSKKAMMFEFVAERWGSNHVATVGTHQRLQNKSAVQAVARALDSLLPDDFWQEVVIPFSKLVDAAEADTAGLGLSWDDLWARAGDELEPYRAAYPEFFEIAGSLRSRLKTYGKHPAGVIIDPDDELTGNLPLRAGEDGEMIAQFDLKVLEMLGYVKFDMLNLRTLDTLQLTVDLIEKYTGKRVSPYTWRDELSDPYVYEQLAEGWTLGCFQIETTLGTEMCRTYRPTSLRELADVITLVRPGPRNSGLTKTYLRRRDGREEVSQPDPRMADILAGTQGCMIYQEQLMALCMELALYDDIEADHVRRILGKKKLEEAKKEKPQFIERAVANGTDRQVTEDLWAQMEEFAKYSFGFGHAMGYAMLGVWTAWFKIHYPLFFLCAVLSTVDSEKIPDLIEEARRMGYKVLPPDINESGFGFSVDSSFTAVRYGLDAVKGIGPAVVQSVVPYQPYKSWEDFQERKGAKCNAGAVKTLTSIGAFDSLAPNRKWLEKVLEVEGIAGSDRCVHKGQERDIVWLPTPKRGEDAEEETLEHALPCGFDWVNEPPVIGRTGKPMKRKPPPKKCTRGCRNYTPLAPPEPDDVTPYTDEEIREIEMATLGAYLSSTPFERIPEEDRGQFATAVEILTGPMGSYPIAAVISGFRTAQKRDDMGFLTLATERGRLSCVVFPKLYEKHRHQFRKGSLVYATVTKTDRGQTLDLFMPIDE